jgi:hypothetical protein
MIGQNKLHIDELSSGQTFSFNYVFSCCVIRASRCRPLSFSSPTVNSQSVCFKLAPAVPSVGTLFAKFHTAKKKFSIRLRGRPNPTNSNKHISPGYKSNNQAQTSGRIAKPFHLSDLSQLATRRKTRSSCLSEEVRVDAAVADLVAVAVVRLFSFLRKG